MHQNVAWPTTPFFPFNKKTPPRLHAMSFLMMSTIEIPAPRPDKSQWLRGVLPIGWRLGSPHGDIVVAPPYSLKPSPGPIRVQRKRSVNREKNSLISKFSNNIQINSQPEFFLPNIFGNVTILYSPFFYSLWWFHCHHFHLVILHFHILHLKSQKFSIHVKRP